MERSAFQDHYPDDAGQCYGCGRLNDRGHRIRTFWDGDETLTRFTPEPFHTAVPGVVYGGLLASLVDCHGTGSAAGAGYRAEGREPGTEPPLRYVTASLAVRYLKPTPLGPELEIRGRIVEVKDRGEEKARKVVVAVRLLCDGVETVRGEVVAVKMPEGMGTRPS